MQLYRKSNADTCHSLADSFLMDSMCAVFLKPTHALGLYLLFMLRISPKNKNAISEICSPHTAAFPVFFLSLPARSQAYLKYKSCL